MYSVDASRTRVPDCRVVQNGWKSPIFKHVASCLGGRVPDPGRLRLQERSAMYGGLYRAPSVYNRIPWLVPAPSSRPFRARNYRFLLVRGVLDPLHVRRSGVLEVVWQWTDHDIGPTSTCMILTPIWRTALVSPPQISYGPRVRY